MSICLFHQRIKNGMERNERSRIIAYFNHYVKIDFSIGIHSNFSWAAKIAAQELCVRGAFYVWIFYFLNMLEEMWIQVYIEGRVLKLCIKLHIVHDFLECIIRSIILCDRTNWNKRIGKCKLLKKKKKTIFRSNDSTFKLIAIKIIIMHTLKMVIHGCIEIDVW